MYCSEKNRRVGTGRASVWFTTVCFLQLMNPAYLTTLHTAAPWFASKFAALQEMLLAASKSRECEIYRLDLESGQPLTCCCTTGFSSLCQCARNFTLKLLPILVLHFASHCHPYSAVSKIRQRIVVSSSPNLSPISSQIIFLHSARARYYSINRMLALAATFSRGRWCPL